MLYDSRVMHSFIPIAYVHCLNRHVRSIGQTYRIVLPSDDIIMPSYWLCVVPVVISERELCADLVMLGMTDYDVILGMDFLPKYGAMIDCKDKLLVSTRPEKRSLRSSVTSVVAKRCLFRLYEQESG